MSGVTAANPRRRRAWIVAGLAVGTGLVVAHTVFFSVCVVRGASMEPTLGEGERVLVWRRGRIARGDVVVFSHPDATDELLVKRVVAVEGSTVGSYRGRLVVDEIVLEESWVKPGTALGPLPPLVVPPGRLYLLGDNRAESIDTRTLGTIDRHLVVGVVVCKLWPPGGMGR